MKPRTAKALYFLTMVVVVVVAVAFSLHSTKDNPVPVEEVGEIVAEPINWEETEPTESPKNIVAPAVLTHAVTSSTFYVLGDHVVERMEPDTRAIPLGSYMAGETVLVVGEENGWYRLDDGGYIRGDLLTDNFDDIIPHYLETYPDLIVTIIKDQYTGYWKDGKKIAGGYCVTGDAYQHPTPIGLFQITSRQFDVDEYPGDDWFCTFNGQIGYHNAGWANPQFGGEIYKGNGSHGCIRTSDDLAKTIYENCRVGSTYVLILP